MKHLLPTIYKTDTSIHSPYRQGSISGLSSRSHSHHNSPARTLSPKEFAEHTESRDKISDPETPYLEFYNTPLQNILPQLDQLKIDTKRNHEHWEFQLNKLQNKLLHEHTEIQTKNEEERKQTLQKFTYLDKLLHKIQILFGEMNLFQSTAYDRNHEMFGKQPTSLG